MSEFDAKKMLEALTEEEESRPDLARGTVEGPVSRKAAPKPSRSSSSVSASPKKKTKRSAKPKLDSSKDSGRVTNPSVDEEVAATSSSSARPEKARRGMARQLERSGRCPMHASVGTVCKSCGKVHPL